MTKGGCISLGRGQGHAVAVDGVLRRAVLVAWEHESFAADVERLIERDALVFGIELGLPMGEPDIIEMAGEPVLMFHARLLHGVLPRKPVSGAGLGAGDRCR